MPRSERKIIMFVFKLLDFIDSLAFFFVGFALGIMLFNPGSIMVGVISCVGLIVVEYLRDRAIQLEIAEKWERLSEHTEDI
jgi:hypothetical protein